ncbi:CDGSH iron-sulfur domain-containing protein [Solimicrobium silvestre]|uniref:Iron-binding zinc finger CDGSH type domain-containing protein n=1 Tax=Solimicrobium silvestre TaxID=2099400 RepID=A0A2S9H3Y9_9BURK|nr:CDGSH iron-sulfur domain-containing protein [Solimicrobium silvestre]PRC94586.1 hypothetical protein S2091_0589 [Solimicrobium silvestre]
MSIEIVQGREATIQFDAQRCVHSRNCVLSHPDVFVPNIQGEWIHPDAQPLEELIRLAQNCPSGAIRVMRNAQEETTSEVHLVEVAPLVNTVRVRENGPLALEAEFQIEGESQETPRATLCRCGLSKNKPYCDGAHQVAGFFATGEPVIVPYQGLAARNGLINIEPLPDGPLHIVGNLEIVSGTGRTCNTTIETYLCRCGHSANKPYCDGAHITAGFKTVEKL